MPIVFLLCICGTIICLEHPANGLIDCTPFSDEVYQSMNGTDTYFNYELLLHQCFSNTSYDPISLPMKNGSRTPIYYDFQAISFQAENSGLMKISFSIVIGWKDPRLEWGAPDEYGSTMLVYAKEVWHPSFDFIPCMAENCNIKPEEDSTIHVNKSGFLSYQILRSIESFCQMSFRNFPYDEQQCSLNFILNNNFRFKVARFQLISSNLYYQESFPNQVTNQQWTIMGTEKVNGLEMARETTKFLGEDAALGQKYLKKWFTGANIQGLAPYTSGFTIHLNIARVSTNYVFIILVPLAILILLMPLVGFIPASSGEKIGYSITIVLAYIFFQSMAASIIPPSYSIQLLTFAIYGGLACALLVLMFSICAVASRDSSVICAYSMWHKCGATRCVDIGENINEENLSKNDQNDNDDNGEEDSKKKEEEVHTKNVGKNFEDIREENVEMKPSSRKQEKILQKTEIPMKIFNSSQRSATSGQNKSGNESESSKLITQGSSSSREHRCEVEGATITIKGERNPIIKEENLDKKGKKKNIGNKRRKSLQKKRNVEAFSNTSSGIVIINIIVGIAVVMALMAFLVKECKEHEPIMGPLASF